MTDAEQCMEIARLRIELTRLHAQIADEERKHLATIDQRDEAENAISQAYFIATGNSPEWSNNFGHNEAVEEIEEVINLLKRTLTKSHAQIGAMREALRICADQFGAWATNSNTNPDDRAVCANCEDHARSVLATPSPIADAMVGVVEAARKEHERHGVISCECALCTAFRALDLASLDHAKAGEKP